MAIYRGTGGASSITSSANIEAVLEASVDAVAAAAAASVSEINAANSAASAANIYDDFDDRYLGAKASEPSVDNDGDPLQDGALYFNTTDGNMYFYDQSGGFWDSTKPTSTEQTAINAVAANEANINSAVSNEANITTVAGSISNVNTVAGSISNVNTVATDIANVNIAATNVADINNFADVYQGGKSVAPTTRNDTSALQEGDLYFNTVNDTLYVYTGSTWEGQLLPNTTVESSTLSSGQTAVVFTGSVNYAAFYISGPDTDNGRLLYGTDYTVDSATNTVTLTQSYPAGTQLSMLRNTSETANITAEAVAFAASGAGAVNRTASDKLRETVSVKDFGAVGDGVTDDTAAIQAALDLGGDIYFPAGGYVITSSLELRETCHLIGQTDPINTVRNMVRILPSGNFAAFTNDSTGISGQQYTIENFQIFWGYSTPTTSVGNDQKMGFYFTKKTASPWTAPYSVFRNIEVNGAWYVFYDDTDNYKNRLEGVVGRYNWYGFYKRLGTTFLFERCSNALGKQAFHIENFLSPMLVDCSADTMAPDASTPGNTAVYLYNAEGFSVNGWDAEGANIDGDGYSYMRIRGSVGTVSNFTLLGNALDNVSGTVSFFNVADSSNVTFIGIRQTTLSGTPLSFAGTAGACAMLYVSSSAKATCIGGDFTAPTGGTPATRYSVYGLGGNITLINALTDNTEAGVVFKTINGSLDLTADLTCNDITGTGNLDITGTSRLKNTVWSGVGSSAEAVNTCTLKYNATYSPNFVFNTGNPGTQYHAYFRYYGSNVGNISSSTTATNYATSSDYRLKEDWQPIVNASDKIKQLTPVNFAWKVNGERVDGFLAHELQAVIPEAVVGDKDAVDEEGNPVYQGVDQSKLVPILTATVQELLARIEALESK